MTPTKIDDSQRVVPVDLLPCPFCNAEPAYFSGTNIQYGHGESSDYAGVRCSVCRVEISFCNYAGYQLTERMALAAEKWNRRAASPPASPEERRYGERYRWLRSQPNDTSVPRIDVVQWIEDDESANAGTGLRMEALDAAIDAARGNHEGV